MSRNAHTFSWSGLKSELVVRGVDHFTRLVRFFSYMISIFFSN